MTSHAAIGAANIPPTMKVIAIVQFISSQPNEIRNPKVAEIAIANSLVSTVPITFLGEAPFWVKSTGVVIGPHPPPPVASANPAINPNKVDFFLDKSIDFYRFSIDS